MREFEFVIRNDKGMQGTEATNISREADHFVSKIYIEHKGTKLNAKSLMGMVALRAVQGDTLKVQVNGGDEDLAAPVMLRIMEEELGDIK